MSAFLNKAYEPKQEPKEELKQEIKQEVKQEVKQSSPETFVIKTELDAYISDKLKTQPLDINDIVVDDVENQRHWNILELPNELEKALKKKGMAPRWINKDKRAIDRATNIRRWLIVNRTYFPELPKHLFTANGTIENGDLILGFMPATRAEKLRKLPGELSRERIKALPIEKYKDYGDTEKIGYYKPTYTGERDGEMLKVNQDPKTGFQPDLPSQE